MTNSQPHTKPGGKPQTAGEETIDAQTWRARLEAALDFPGAMREVMREAIRSTSTAGSEAIATQEKSQERRARLVDRTLKAIEKELEKPDLSAEERRALIDRMMTLIDKADANDAEGRRFLAGLTQERMKAALLVASGVGAVAIGAVAGPEGLRQVGAMLPNVAQRTLKK